MTPEAHRRVRKLFDEALERPEAERLSFLKSVCAGDDELYQKVVRLLEAHGQSESFLEDEAPKKVHQIGRYVIVGELGRGAMGIVFDAIDPLIGRTVAIKTIHLQSLTGEAEAEFLKERLFREARSAGALFHPGIVVVFDVGQEGDMAFIAMERVEGQSLFQMMQSGPKIDRATALDILRQTAAALDYAHQQGIVHRDIKPANIMLHKGTAVKIADFGIAKITTSSDHTRTGMMMGTPSYMSPEQIETKPLDGRSDQFSLAVVAYELLAGVKPFQGASLVPIMHMIVEGPRPSARAANPSLPEGVDQVLERGLSKAPGDRYRNCTEFIAALEGVLKDRPKPVVAPTPPPLAPPAAPRPSPLPAAAPRPSPPPAPPLSPPAFNTASLEGIKKKSRDTTPYLIGAGLVVLAAGALLYQYVGGSSPAVVSQVVTPPVTKPAAPVVTGFTVSPESIATGESATLRWDVSGSTKIVIDQGVGEVAASGAIEVKPTAETHYMLTASGPGGSTSAELLVKVTPKPPAPGTKISEPKIVSFRAEPGSVKRGQKFQLSWTVKEASKVTIDPGVGTVKSADSRTLTLEGTTTYTLTATNKGGTVKELATVLMANEPAQPGGAQLYSDAMAQRALQPAKALVLFRQAADAGEPRAMLELGKIARTGEGGPKDLVEAARWFRKAADAHNASGMLFLGAMYAQGGGVAKDYVEAARWFRQAADAGNGAGMDALGRMYSTGQGVTKDDAEATRWYRKGFEAGSSAATYHLASAYESGQGVAHDANEALRLYRLAAAAGSPEASVRVVQLQGGKKVGRAPVSIGVPGNQTWTDTGIILNAGDTVAVTASGSVKVTVDGRVSPKSPAGFVSNCTAAAAMYGRTPEPYPAPQLRCWSLIARVGAGGPAFEIGARKTFQVKVGGKLYFGVNDNSVADNSGSWTAVVTVQ